ncbi:MAG: tRNA pseudouridine(55) synthase TruB [Cyanobacteria bacterium P01_H01_bin.58]
MSGFLNLDKPVGWTSHDCVAKVRRLLRQKKVGHGGTLDPAACGVLPIALGRATRLLQFLPGEKAYRAVIRFGITTTTDDLEGEVLASQAATTLTWEMVTSLIPCFIGTLEQIPPRYSAIQVRGKRLYELARQGKAVEMPVRTVVVDSITPQQWQPGEFPELTVDITCGSGTYIRSIARDWGNQLGTGATLVALERTASSGFTQAESLTLEQLESQLNQDDFRPVSPAIALRHLPQITLDAESALRWQQGQKIAHAGSANASFYRVHDADSQFLGITEWEPMPENNKAIKLLPKTVFQIP